MSEAVKKPNQNPESYSPKKPEILSMAQYASQNALPPVLLLDNVFPTGHNPWVGGCDFLRCFTSLYMHLEELKEQHEKRYGLYRKFLVVSGMGMATIFTDAPGETNYCFEAADDYIGRLNRFTGYKYLYIESSSVDKSKLFGDIMRSLADNKPVMAVYSRADKIDKYNFDRKWLLFIGYNTDDMSLSINVEENVTSFFDWFENLRGVVFITKTGLEKPNIKDVLIEIINDAERSETHGVKYGHAAYEELIAKLSDDEFFAAADDKTLEQFNNGGEWNGGSLSSFFWYHAEGRGAFGEGCGELCSAEINGTPYETDFGCNGFYGYNGHQSAYIGAMAIKKGGVALRDKKHREILIYALRQMMSNDAKIIKMIKMAIGIDTPDILYPKNEKGEVLDYCFRSKDMAMWKTPVLKTAKIALFSSSDADKKVTVAESCIEHMEKITVESVMLKCNEKKTYAVNFNSDIMCIGQVDHKEDGGIITVKSSDNIYEAKGLMKTMQSFCPPLKIDAYIENNDTAFILSYNNGYMKNSSWGKQPGKILTWDISVGYCMDFNTEFPAIENREVKISWIIQRDFMAVIVNGELVHYIENLPYTHFDMPTAQVGFGAFDDHDVVVKSLVVTELE